VTNLEFTKTLGQVLGRPTVLPVPAFAARLAFGEMADAILLSSTRVVPARLQEAGYQFAHPELEGALRHVLKK
jgi:NAD dependent epimerase/dehydratase family enzyme